MSFQTEFLVRDYECDLQGIVNNAEYFHYFEHARHLFCRDVGLNFSALHDQGIDLVAVRAEIDYRAALRSGDQFVVTVEIERVSRLRWAFLQRLLISAPTGAAARGATDEPQPREAAAGRCIVTSLLNGRPAVIDAVVAALERSLQS
jgi:acyl-CoA thioester hydrolase